MEFAWWLELPPSSSATFVVLTLAVVLFTATASIFRFYLLRNAVLPQVPGTRQKRVKHPPSIARREPHI